MATSSCGCSMPFMTITVFSRSWCSTARGVSSRPCCGLASGRVGRRSAALCAVWSALSAPCGPRSRSCCALTAIMPVRKYSTGAAPTGWVGSSAWLPTPHSPVTSRHRKRVSRFRAAPAHGTRRRFTQFYDAAQSWRRVERIIARVEAGPQGTNTRFIVTNLSGGRAKHLYEGLYCARGQAENHIKAWKNHLAADRTSCHEAEANQFRLFLHAGAYWLLWSMRRLMPKRSIWRVMQFDTLRLRLIKLASRMIERKTQIKIQLPSIAPDQAIFAVLLDRLPRLVT